MTELDRTAIAEAGRLARLKRAMARVMLRACANEADTLRAITFEPGCKIQEADRELCSPGDAR